MKHRLVWILAAVGIAIALLAIFTRTFDDTPGRAPETGVLLQETPEPVAARPGPGTIALTPPAAEEIDSTSRSPLADALGSPSLPPEDEPRIVYELFSFYRREFKAFPAGEENAQWMNALRGRNPGKLAILPSNHPRLNPGGALVDAWDQPFFVHQISRERIQVRSGGPDRQLFTADDLTFPQRPDLKGD